MKHLIAEAPPMSQFKQAGPFFRRIKKLKICSVSKADYELAGMIGEIIELLEEGKTLRESFEDENYYEELFMSSAKDFASQLKKKCNFLFTSIKDALINMTNISR